MMPRNRKRRFLFLSLAAVLAILGFALWTQREAVLREGLTWGAQRAGIVVEGVEGLQAGPYGISAGHLSLLLPESGLRLDMTDLALSFQPGQLWEQRRVESLRLARLALTRVPAEPGSEETEALQPARWLPLLERPPVGRLSIAELDLPWGQDGSLRFEQTDAGWDLSLALAGLALRVQLAPGQGDAPAVSDLSLSDAGSRLLAATVQLGTRGDDLLLDARGSLEPAPLAARLAAGLPAGYLPVAGTLDFALATGVLEALHSQAVTLQLSEHSWLRLPPDLLPGLSALELRLRESVGLPLRFAPSPALEAVDLPLSWSGHWRERSFSLLMDLSPACGFVPAPDCRVPHRLELRSDAIPAWLQPLRLEGDVHLAGSGLSVRQALSVADARLPLSLQIAASHQLDAREGEASLVLPTLAFSPDSRLSQRLPGWPWPADLAGGGLAAEAGLRWRLPAGGAPEWEGEAALRLEALAGAREPYFFRGLSGEMLARIEPEAAFPLSLPPTVLSLDELDLGLPVRDIRLAFALDGEARALRVEEFSAALLGGRVFAEDQRYDLDVPRNRFELRFEGLRVERLLDLAEYEGVEASGVLSGRIPLLIAADGQVQVEQGELGAGPDGGVIRYLPPGGTGGGNPGLDLVEQALSNYHYESLESSVDYLPGGELQLSMRLQGYNPDMNGGQRINLNLNLSDNIPQLLRSLQAGRRVEDFLRERVE